jgi:hypothetical protein
LLISKQNPIRANAATTIRYYPDRLLGNLIIGAFDRIYTSPLLSFRAFRRSAAISSLIWVVVFVVPWIAQSDALQNIVLFPINILYFAIDLIIITLSDYVSLLFVRRYLSLARINPIRSTIVASALGVVIVMISSIVFLTMVLGYQVGYFHQRCRITLGD